MNVSWETSFLSPMPNLAMRSFLFCVGMDQEALAQIDFMSRSRVSRDMNGKVIRFQDATVRPEPVEGERVGLGNNPSREGIPVENLDRN